MIINPSTKLVKIYISVFLPERYKVLGYVHTERVSLARHVHQKLGNHNSFNSLCKNHFSVHTIVRGSDKTL